MVQIRIHRRSGQGVVTAAEMLSIAAFEQGHHAQASPSFGSERTGAPVVAFARIDEREIRLREPVLAPDVLIVQDSTLLHRSIQRGLLGAVAFVVDRGAIGSPLGLMRRACTMGSRWGEPARSLAVLRASIALRTADRCVPSAAGPPSGASVYGRPTTLGRRVHGSGCR